MANFGTPMNESPSSPPSLSSSLELNFRNLQCDDDNGHERKHKYKLPIEPQPQLQLELDCGRERKLEQPIFATQIPLEKPFNNGIKINNYDQQLDNNILPTNPQQTAELPRYQLRHQQPQQTNSARSVRDDHNNEQNYNHRNLAPDKHLDHDGDAKMAHNHADHGNDHPLINQWTLETIANTSAERTSIISIETATTNAESDPYYGDTTSLPPPPRQTAMTSITNLDLDQPGTNSIGSLSRLERSTRRPRTVVRKFRQIDQGQLISTPSPDVKIGQRIAFREYYGNEFGTIRWIGRVPQISPDWTVGVEFDNAIGEGDGSLHGRRYFIAKDCFAKFLPLDQVALVDQHVGRPEPGTMISVMSAAVRPGQMISIQRVSTVHVQHCFLNAPHHKPGADILAVNTRLHCQCPSCGPCAHVIKPPRTQRLPLNPKNATHMCQFSTYTCCGMESQEEALCTYTGNKISASLPPPIASPSLALPPVGNSWIEGSGYLASLQAQRSKLMPLEYKLGVAPQDGIGGGGVDNHTVMRSASSTATTSRRHPQRSESSSRRRHDLSHSSFKDKNSSSSQSRSGAAKPKDCSVSQSRSEQNLKSEYQAFSGAVCDDLSTGLAQHPSDSLWDSETFTQLDGSNSLNGEQTKVAIDPTERTFGGSLNHTPDTPSLNSDESFTLSRTHGENSVVNHFPFPDDELIDSTLEADLENLSQARYGPKSNSNRRVNASKYIFRSLRSLVSCLNAPAKKQIDLNSYSRGRLKLLDRGEFSSPTNAMYENDFMYYDRNESLSTGQTESSISNQNHVAGELVEQSSCYIDDTVTKLESQLSCVNNNTSNNDQACTIHLTGADLATENTPWQGEG